MNVGGGKSVEYVLGQRGGDCMAECELGMIGKGHLSRMRAGRGVGLCCVDEVGWSKAKIVISQKTIGVGKAAVGATELGGGPVWRVEGEREYQGGGPKKRLWVKLPKPPRWSMEKGIRRRWFALMRAVVVVS